MVMNAGDPVTKVRWLVSNLMKRKRCHDTTQNIGIGY